MRVRALLPTLFFAAVVVTAIVLGPLPAWAAGSEVTAEPANDVGTVFVQVQEQTLDGTCVALDPATARPHLRGAFCTLLCLEPQSAEAESTEAVRILRRAPLSAREAAVEELLFDVALRDTEALAAAVPGIAERHGLSEDALRDVVVTAREQILEQLSDEGVLDDANAACLLERLNATFDTAEPASSP